MSRAVSQIAVSQLAVAMVFIVLRVLNLFDAGHTVHGFLLSVAAVAESAVAIGWWRTRGRADARSRALAAIAAVGGIVVWGLSDNTMGVPVFAVAMCIAVVAFGVWAGVAMAAVMIAAVLALYLGADGAPSGGAAANLVMILAVSVLALAAAYLIAQLDRAIALEAETARLRREEALAEMDRVLADERMGYAQLLHDELGQRLTAIGMELDLATRLRASGPDAEDAAWSEVERGRTAVSDALDELRTLVRSMSPLGASEYRRLDTDAALDTIARTFTGTGLAVHVERSGTAPGALDQLAYRIIQEGLTNAARHSGADNVTVSVFMGESCTIRIHDDGHADPQGHAEGFGLVNLRERVESAGGSLVAGPGEEGFALDASYPLQTENA